MKSLAELDQLRAKTRKNLAASVENGSKKIVVGMATCGIAAGAKNVLNALTDEIRLRNIHGVLVSITGCIGICRLEPIIEVFDQDGQKITYVKMDEAKARRVINEHIVNGQICRDLTISANDK
jgi:NADP-reducing hydrogenase subunit HndB